MCDVSKRLFSVYFMLHSNMCVAMWQCKVENSTSRRVSFFLRIFDRRTAFCVDLACSDSVFSLKLIVFQLSNFMSRPKKNIFFGVKILNWQSYKFFYSIVFSWTQRKYHKIFILVFFFLFTMKFAYKYNKWLRTIEVYLNELCHNVRDLTTIANLHFSLIRLLCIAAFYFVLFVSFSWLVYTFFFVHFFLSVCEMRILYSFTVSFVANRLHLFLSN